MKRKSLALLLVIVLIAITISTGLPTAFASGENLLTNGDFANYSGTAPTGWSLKDLYGDATAQIVEDVKINDSLTTNAWKLTTPTGYGATVGSEDTRVWLKHDAPFDIKKSANYTTTFWVKVKNISDFSLYLYETNNSTTWQSENNLYTFDAEQTDKDIRTDVFHKVQIDGGNNLQNAPKSLYEDKSTLVTSFNNQWVKIVHTFATENDDSHAAKATYGFIINQAAGGEFWLADVKTTVVEDVPTGSYTPKTNDATLGFVNAEIPLVPGKKVKMIAEPFGEHTFEGWFKGSETTPVSTDLEYSFVYDAGVTPDYTAKFKKADFFIENGGYENSTTGKVANVTYNGNFNNFTDNGFTAGSKDGIHFVESTFSQNFRELTVTTEKAHTGTKSLKANMQCGYYGRKITGLKKNSQYVLSVYAYATGNAGSDIYSGTITGGTSSVLTSNGSGGVKAKASTDPSVLYYFNYYWATLNGANAYRIKCLNNWKRIDISFNAGNNTEAIVWFYLDGGSAALYLDNFNIKRVPNEYTPKVNDINLGYVEPIKGTTVLPGEEVTVTAKPLDGNSFAGWFANSTATTPISTDLTYTHTFDPSTSLDIEARFTAGEYAIDYAGFEGEPYKTHWVSICKHTDSGTGATCYSAPWAIASPSTGGWQAVMVDHTAAHTGKASISLAMPYAAAGYTLTGLKPNTNYTFSYYLYAKKTGYVGRTTVLPGTTSLIKPTGGYYATSDPEVLGYNGTQTCPEWVNYKTSFNTKDNTSVTVWFDIQGSEGVNIDNISVFESIKAVAMAEDNRGSVTKSFTGESIAKGSQVEITATPYGANTFDGWYNEAGTKVSSSATYSFTASGSFTYIAKFKGDDRPIVGFEEPEYVHGQSLVSHMTGEKGAITTNGFFGIGSTFTGGWQGLTINKQTGYNSTTSLNLGCQFSAASYTIRNLEPNTEYYFRYYANTLEGGSVQRTFVIPADKSPFTEAKNSYIGNDETLGYSGSYTLGSSWTAIDTVFNTGDNTDVTVWFLPVTESINIDNLEIRKGPIKAKVTGEIGGNIDVNFDGNMIYKGFQVDITATPLKGNTFAGWYSESGALVSSSANYKFAATTDFNLIAKFNGDNKPAVDMLAKQGYDGTFEKGMVPGWKAFSSSLNYSWCGGNVITNDSYDGNKAYEYHAQWSTTILPLDNLSENTDYKLSYWVKLSCDESISNAGISHMAIVNSGANELDTASKTYAYTTGKFNTKNEWNKFEFYFNTGDATSVELLVQYNGDTTNIRFDNIEFYQFAANESLGNGNFENGFAKWVGDFDVVTDSGSKVLSVGANKTAYQTIKVKEFTAYTVSFRAKGNLTAAALDATADKFSYKNLITSKSYTDVKGQTWTDYTYEVYSGSDSALSVAFEAGLGGAMIDDVKIEAKTDASKAKFEHIDFETDRFSYLGKNTNSNAWSIYTATDEDDTNVHSGNKSLKFSANASTVDLENKVEAEFVSYQIGKGNFMRITISYKFVDGNEGGAFYFAPDISGTYGTDVGFEHTADDDEWHTATYYVTNTTRDIFKMVLANISGRTTGDLYIDDIIIEVAPSMVSETTTTITYCERLYNAIDNESFETTATAKDWKGLPANIKIVSGDALKGSHYLQAKSGSHYVLEVDVKPGTIYYFGASVRGNSQTKGYIGIATDASGNKLLVDRNNNEASFVANKAGESGWARSGFSFISAGTGKAYIVIDVDSGTLDIDSVMLFTADYGYRYDPNDYTVYVPYDYDNLKSSTTVINGGYGPQPYYSEASTATGSLPVAYGAAVEADTEELVGVETAEAPEVEIEEVVDSAPQTGESNVLAAALSILAVTAVAVILLAKKRKDGANNA